MSGGEFAWVSPWITVDHPRLTRVMLNLTAHSKVESESNEDTVQVYATTRDDNQSLGTLFRFEVSEQSKSEFVTSWSIVPTPITRLLPGKETYPLDSLLGQLSEPAGSVREGPTEIRVIVRSNTASGSIFAIDNLKVVEEPFEGVLPPNPATIFPGFLSVDADLVGFPPPTEANAALPHLDFSVRYLHAGEANGLLIDPTSFGDDDLSLYGYEDVRFELLSVESNQILGEEGPPFLTHYRIHRPETGWESLPQRMTLITRVRGLFPEGNVSYRGATLAPLKFSLRIRSFLFSPPLEPISQDVAFVDLPIRFTAREPIALETLGNDDLYVRFGVERETVRHTARGTIASRRWKGSHGCLPTESSRIRMASQVEPARNRYPIRVETHRCGERHQHDLPIYRGH